MTTATAQGATPEPSVQPATYTRKGLARCLGRSISTIDTDIARGHLPAGFRIGRCRYWLREEISRWLDAGAPEQAEWEAQKAARQQGALVGSDLATPTTTTGTAPGNG
jgi:predicted DNA-binding transcriptional regulator AlpA